MLEINKQAPTFTGSLISAYIAKIFVQLFSASKDNVAIKNNIETQVN